MLSDFWHILFVTNDIGIVNVLDPREEGGCGFDRTVSELAQDSFWCLREEGFEMIADEYNPCY